VSSHSTPYTLPFKSLEGERGRRRKEEVSEAESILQ